VTQPLRSRPDYSTDTPPALPRGAESKLPGGSPGGKGLPLDSGLPGTLTFAQPTDNHREPTVTDTHPSKVENADDLLKDRGRIDVRDLGGDVPSYYGKGPSDAGNPKTKYPYRDGLPNEKNASLTERVARRYLSRLPVLRSR